MTTHIYVLTVQGKRSFARGLTITTEQVARFNPDMNLEFKLKVHFHAGVSLALAMLARYLSILFLRSSICVRENLE